MRFLKGKISESINNLPENNGPQNLREIIMGEWVFFFVAPYDLRFMLKI